MISGRQNNDYPKIPISYSLEPVNMLGYMAKEIKAANWLKLLISWLNDEAITLDSPVGPM